jgi:hypothetical protein
MRVCVCVCVYVCVLYHSVGAIPGHCVTGCLLVTVTELELWLVQLITTNETHVGYFFTVSRLYGIFLSWRHRHYILIQLQDSLVSKVNCSLWPNSGHCVQLLLVCWNQHRIYSNEWQKLVPLNVCFTLIFVMYWIKICIYIIKKNLEASLVANNRNGLKVTAEKTKFTSGSGGRQNRNMIGNQFFNGK